MINSDIGCVVIGRNEGERLRRCLESVVGRVACVIYVDSGSTDGSIQLARCLGVEVVALDMSIPFTAARARNTGFKVLIDRVPGLRYVQFVDGDCEVVSGWIELAKAFLEQHPGHAVVCGRRRERYPDHSIYNRLCDIEWDTPVGDAYSCGGDALMRTDAFMAVNGYRPTLIAGEEPELCVRLRREGWKIFRVDADMTLHDADMLRLGQWWKRSMRAGYAFAEGAYLHGAPPERHWVRETGSAVFWGGFLPFVAMVLSTVIWWLGALLFAVYPVQWVRLALKSDSFSKIAMSRAFFLIVGKFPEFFGAMKFVTDKVLRSHSAIIEYK